jgi:hypothetical protein
MFALFKGEERISAAGVFLIERAAAPHSTSSVCKPEDG